MALNQTFTDDYLLKYAELERVRSIDAIGHRIIRAVLHRHSVPPGVEIVSLADIPSGTGLGSSGAFTVGLLRAIYAHRREPITDGALAEEAADIEINVLGEPVGKQDQYIAAFGGLTCFTFHPDDHVSVSPLRVSQQTLHELEERLLLFFTGYMRPASEILGDQRTRTEADDGAMVDNLKHTKALGLRIREALEAGEPAVFGELMRDHWEAKRRRSQGMSNPAIDAWYETALANGAVGGKLVGAGTGGFLMFYAEDPARLRAAMADQRLSETRFSFDLDGTTVIVRD